MRARRRHARSAAAGRSIAARARRPSRVATSHAAGAAGTAGWCSGRGGQPACRLRSRIRGLLIERWRSCPERSLHGRPEHRSDRKGRARQVLLSPLPSAVGRLGKSAQALEFLPSPRRRRPRELTPGRRHPQKRWVRKAAAWRPCMALSRLRPLTVAAATAHRAPARRTCQNCIGALHGTDAWSCVRKRDLRHCCARNAWPWRRACGRHASRALRYAQACSAVQS